jgi:hypothetical protein
MTKKMEISREDGIEIVRMADTCHSEGLLTGESQELARRVLNVWFDISEEATIYTGFLLEEA